VARTSHPRHSRARRRYGGRLLIVPTPTATSPRRSCILSRKQWPNISGFSPSRGGADQDSVAVHGCQPEMCQAIRQCRCTGGQPVARTQGIEQREVQVVQTHNKEKMALVRLRASQLGQVTLNEGRIKRCAQRLIELTKGLVRAAPCTTLVDHRPSHAMSICGGNGWMALHLHRRLSNQPPNVGVDLSHGQVPRVRHPDALAAADDLGVDIAQSGQISTIFDLDGPPPLAGQRPSKAIPRKQGIKVEGRTTIGRQLGHLERASTAVWVVKKGVNRALPRRHVIRGGYRTERALSDSTRRLFDVVEAPKTFQHA
jgi:hypothetical protein